jgi:hypothetical protein
MHGLEHLARRDKDIVTTSIWPNESKAIAVAHELARELQVIA